MKKNWNMVKIDIRLILCYCRYISRRKLGNGIFFIPPFLSMRNSALRESNDFLIQNGHSFLFCAFEDSPFMKALKASCFDHSPSSLCCARHPKHVSKRKTNLFVIFMGNGNTIHIYFFSIASFSKRLILI